MKLGNYGKSIGLHLLSGFYLSVWVLLVGTRLKCRRIYKRAAIRLASYLLQCQIDRIVYSECISYQACLLRTCTLYSAGQVCARRNSKCIILACVIPRKRSDPLTRVKLPHSLPAKGHCVSNVHRYRQFFRRRLTRGFLWFPATGRGLIRSLCLCRSSPLRHITLYVWQTVFCVRSSL